MRPLRMLLSLSTSLVAITLLLYIALVSPQGGNAETAPASASAKTASFKAFFSFASPGSLFPPSAIISLTDDNSTFFLARPAAFGPDLPKNGLSGPLWIGHGFGDDETERGELGCGDIPGWNDDNNDLFDLFLHSKHGREVEDTIQQTGPFPRRDISTDEKPELFENSSPNDGTDDYLRLHSPYFYKSQQKTHGDSLSLQQGAGMAGKIALLKRGGCGFLAKVQWAQSRGATAVIVGDDVRGGALIRMYAKGDTSNITIPSLFTSHTTAHLLSSLTPPERSLGGNPSETEAQVDMAAEEDSELPSSKHNIKSNLRSRDVRDDAQSRASWVRAILSCFSSGQSSGNTSITHHKWLSFINEAHTVKQSPRQKRHWSRQPVTNDGSLPPQEPVPHEGLWVTLTPTNVSTSPFFDTLLVLVVSPLVTLTVVYALLLLRSRIRRRRWRAPKSVVERLPVRTYQTMSDSMSSATPNASSPATPLLQHSPSQSASSPSSPHSEPESDRPVTSPSVQQRSRDREEEKRKSGLAAWRRRYCGRQKECVVCLEEYEDGVSRVMSLPCGHEFHADCITPWLVTRRRTCPICKGDVVRSLSQSYQDRLQSSSPTRLSPASQDEDSVQAQAAETRNDSPSASRPVPNVMPTSALGDDDEDDVEAIWSEGEARHHGEGISESMPSEVSTSLRNLSSSISTIVWRGVEAVRNTTGLQRRSLLDDGDRNR